VYKNIAAIVDVHVHTHIDEGGGAVRVTERRDMTRDDADSDGEHVHVPVDDLDNAVEATEGTDMSKVDEEDVMAQHIDNNHDDKVRVDGGTVLPKMGDQMEVTWGDLTVQNRRFVRHQDTALRNIQSPRSVMREPVKKSPPVQQKHVREPPPVRHDDVHEGGNLRHHDAADRDQGVPHAIEGDGISVQESGDGAADDPVDQGHGVCDDTSDDGICAQIVDTAELTKQVGKAGGLHTLERIIMANLDRVGYATVDDEVIVAKEEFEGIQVPVEIKPAVDKDEEEGGDIPTPEDREAGKLGIMMTKSEKFGHERGGGIAKCTRLLCCTFMLVGNAGKLGPRGRGQAHLTAAP
jgi:hypothetical protein